MSKPELDTLLEHDPLALQYVDMLYNTLMEENAMSLHEALTLQHDKKNNVIAVVSDEEDAKKASSETYRSKDALKKAGFKVVDCTWRYLLWATLYAQKAEPTAPA